MTLSVEEALRRIEEKAAMLRFLAHAAANMPEGAGETVYNGIGETCEEIETLAQTARRSLGVEALSTELTRPR